MHNYKIDAKKGQGTYSNVFIAISKTTSERYAIKIMKNKYVNIDKLKKDKEIQALKMLQHPNIIKAHDILYDEQQQKLALVFELMECNLYEYYKQKKSSLTLDRVRTIGHEILEAVQHMHRKGVFHRDIKPENILVQGDKIFKLADFGSCKSTRSLAPYTEYISTRWYRAPECMLNEGYYSQKMDIWSMGCVLFQLYTQYPLFPGETQLDQISTIFTILGTPNSVILEKLSAKSSSQQKYKKIQGIGIQSLIPEAAPEFLNLLNRMLEIDPERRMDVAEALNHPFFYSLTEIKKYRKALIDKISQHKELNLPSLKKSQSKQKVRSKIE